MRTVFMGTPAFAVPYLQALHESEHHIVGVVTQPDRKQGRGMRVRYSPVKEWALEVGLPILQPESLRDGDAIDAIRDWNPDVVVVVAYGLLIPKSLLELPRHGCVNVHPSLLPRHRGASPIQAAILAGDEETGVSTMYMDEGLDSGDVILQARLPIADEDTAGTLGERLTEIGVPLLLETLQRIDEGTAPRVPQNGELATYAPRIEPDQGLIRWSDAATAIHRLIRAFDPAPGAFTTMDGSRVRIWRAKPLERGANRGELTLQDADPGTIVDLSPSGIDVMTGSGCLRLVEVQPENRRRMSAVDFANGKRLSAGRKFGT